ncbi:MAG TPA: DUF560 domain-containing protein [Aliiroseovarius sp.]|nr:DUF560 domain-containing protein [Aliiroseovarius sp.]
MIHCRRLILSFLTCVALLLPGLANGASVFQDIADQINAGQTAAAAARLDDPDLTQTQRLFLQGRLAKKAGNYGDAIAAYREVLRLSPESLLARQELAHTLLLAREYDPAAFHFRELMRLDSRPDARRTYQAYLTRIDRDKPVGISAGFSMVPSSNVNLGTRNTVFNTPFGPFAIAEESRESSGVGVALNVAGYFRKSFGDAMSLRLNWGLDGVYYPQNTDLSTLSANVALAFTNQSARGKWSLTPHLRRTWQDGPQMLAYGVKFGRMGRIGDAFRYSMLFNHEIRLYDGNPGKSGPYTSAAFKLGQQINPTLSLSYGITTRFSRPEDAHRQFNEVEISAGIRKAWEGGLTTGLTLSGGYRGFLGDYPSLSQPRQDQFAKVEISVQNSRINLAGFTPKLSCSYQVNASNVAFYDYDVTKCALGISKNF